MKRWGWALLWLMALPAWGRDVTVGWDNPNTAGDVQWYELQWRNPTSWNQVTIQNPLKAGVEMNTSRLYSIRNVVAGALESWVRACRDRVAGEEISCTSPMVAGWTTGCCSTWATLAVTQPSQPTKPVMAP